MESDLDLPLFGWRSTTAMVLPFPANRLVGKARRVAEVLNSKSKQPEKSRTAYWARITKDLESQLAASGFEGEIITLQLQRFKSSVQRELDRLLVRGKSA